MPDEPDLRRVRDGIDRALFWTIALGGIADLVGSVGSLGDVRRNNLAALLGEAEKGLDQALNEAWKALA